MYNRKTRMQKTSRKREIDIHLPALKRHVRGNIQSILQEMGSFVPQKDIDAAKQEYVLLVKKEHRLKQHYPLLYQDVLLSGIVETQGSPRKFYEEDPDSKLREILNKATIEPSISKYSSGTAFYELASLKRSEQMLMDLENTVEMTPRHLPTFKTVMNVTPRVKQSQKKGNKSDLKSPNLSNNGILAGGYENILRTVEYQQSKIEHLKKRLGGGEVDEIKDSKAIKIAKSFKMVFDFEWANAFRELNSWFKGKENEIIYNLMRIIKFAYPFCQNAAKEQLIHLTNTSAVPLLQPIKLPYLDNYPTAEQREVLTSGEKFAKRYRSEVASVSVPQLCQKFKEIVIEKDFKWNHTQLPKCLRDYIDKCVGIVWLMCVLDPPIAIVWPSEGDKVDTSLYEFFTSRGKVVKLCVWPALLLNAGGPVLSKGSIIAGEK